MIRFINKTLVITKKVKPQKGDWMACYAVGFKNRKSKRPKRIGNGWYLTYHDDSNSARLNAICHGTEKVLWKFGKVK